MPMTDARADFEAATRTHVATHAHRAFPKGVRVVVHRADALREVAPAGRAGIVVGDRDGLVEVAHYGPRGEYLGRGGYEPWRISSERRGA